MQRIARQRFAKRRLGAGVVLPALEQRATLERHPYLRGELLCGTVEDAIRIRGSAGIVQQLRERQLRADIGRIRSDGVAHDDDGAVLAAQAWLIARAFSSA